MSKKISYYTDKQLAGIRWTAKNASLSVSLTVASAFNELYTAHMMLRERPDIYRNQVKKFANEAINKARMKRVQMMNIICNRKFFDTYSDKVIDLAVQDITLFRIGLKQTMDDAGYPDSDFISYIETARVMLTAAAYHFSLIMEEARKRFGEYAYEEAFREFYVQDVQKSWDRVCDAIYGAVDNIDLNTTRNEQAFRVICDNFAQSKYVDECLMEAHAEQPEYVESLLAVERNEQKAAG